MGSCVIMNGHCSRPGCNWAVQWSSQPFVRNRPAGNLLLSAACLFNGLIPAKFFRALELIRVMVIDVRTFFKHQAEFLIPAVCRKWNSWQNSALKAIKATGEPLLMGHDGRADSPVRAILLLSHIQKVNIICICI